MPSVNDIVNLAEALEKCPVAVVEDRCVCVRNRNATCRICVRACSAGAIRVAGNEVSLDASSCTGCGACVSACPTEAFLARKPTDAALQEALAKSHGADEPALVACARIAARHLADPSRFAEVACLARLHERDVLCAVARGASGVLLIDGDCSTCKYGSCDALIDDVERRANVLLASRGVPQRASRRTSFPDELLLESTRGVFGSTRRGFFAEAAAAARETTMAAARAKAGEKLAAPAAAQIGERLRVGQAGTLPQYAMERHEAAIDALDALGTQATGELTSRLFGSVSIDLGKCNACGMCAMFCPSGALRRGQMGVRVDDVRSLEFSACDCVQCGLCRDVCWKGALTLSDTVNVEELFDFEPVSFDLRGVKRQDKTLFGAKTP